MTIHLPKDVEHSVEAAVCSGRFASVDDALAEAWRSFQRQQQTPLAGQAAAEESQAAAPTYKPIWEVAADIRKSIPAEEWAKLPADGARQLDHYIYGSPKRPPA